MVKKIIVLLAFLPFATTGKTDSFQDYPPNPQYDRTESQINAIIELFQLFDKETMKKNLDKWVLQNQKLDRPSMIINSKNITFTKFVADDDIVPILDLDEIQGTFNSILSFTFRYSKKVMEFNGTIEFFHSGNYSSSSCQVGFNFILKLSDHVINFVNIRNHYFKKEEVFEFWRLSKKNFVMEKLDEKSCKNTSEEQRQNMSLSLSVQNDVLQAAAISILERIKLIKKSVFPPILNKWIYPDDDSYDDDGRENEYTRFNSHINIGLFPWLYDHNEFVINGLQNFDTLEIKRDDERVSYSVRFKNVKMHWNIASVTMMQLSFDVPSFYMRGALNKMIPKEDLNIQLLGLVEVSNEDFVTKIDRKFEEMLQVLIANGMEQTIQKILCDGTKKFTSAVREILQPFDEKLFEKSLVDLGKLTAKNSVFSTISSFKLDIEAFHLKNITWLDSHWLEIGGTLKYEKIHGRAEILLQIANNKVNAVPVSIYLFIKEVTIGISMKYSNLLNISNNVADVQIKTNWNETDTTIMITSSHYNLSREERTKIGKQIFQYSTKIIENQIITVTKSTFRPIFDICKNSLSNLTTDRLNNFDNQRSYFASMHDYWRNTTNPHITEAVEITIEGSWNFNPINVHYVNRELSIGGLQLENITASIKHLNNLKNPIVKNYTIGHFSLTINHEKNAVSVKVLSPYPNASDVTEKLKSTVSNFMGYLIYDNAKKNSNYHANFKKFTTKTTKQVILEDKTSGYDASLQFATNFAQILKDKEYSLSGNGYAKPNLFYGNDDPVGPDNEQLYFPENVIPFYQSKPVSLHIFEPKIEEEILVSSDNSLSTNYIMEELIISGNMYVYSDKVAIDRISEPFELRTSQKMNVIFDNNNIKTNKSYTDDGNIKECIQSIFNKTSDYYVKKVVIPLASSFFHDRLKEIPIIRDASKLNYSLFLPQKYFFSITKNMDYFLQSFSTYLIKLYGLQNNFKIISSTEKLTVTSFELTIANLTARIIWNHYVGDYISRMPKIMDLEIREITLYVKTTVTKRVIFIKQSRLLLLGRENSRMVKKLEEELEPIVINRIQQDILQEYSKLNSN